jgi:hypothetical protein
MAGGREERNDSAKDVSHFTFPRKRRGASLSVPLPSKTQLLEAAAYFSLFLTLAGALSPKLVHLVDMVATDVTRWIESVLGFKRRLAELRADSRAANQAHETVKLRP